MKGRLQFRHLLQVSTVLSAVRPQSDALANIATGRPKSVMEAVLTSKNTG
jgi:hypothetical protein